MRFEAIIYECLRLHARRMPEDRYKSANKKILELREIAALITLLVYQGAMG